MKYFLLLCTFFAANLSPAQSAYLIKATVSAGNDTVDFGNALLLDPTDSTIIKGDFITKGLMNMPGVTADKALLKITAPGFEDVFIDVSRPDKSVLDLGEIQLTESEMAELVVTAAKPAFKMEAGKVIVDVENSGLAASGTVIDLLRKSPGVLVDGNNNISIFGKGAARIYLDGQLITSNTMLESISSQDIKEIQVIKNPGAEFDAEGQGGVINIITKANDLQGISGTLGGTLAHGMHWFYSGYGRLNYKKKKLNTYITASDFAGERGSRSNYFRTIYDPSGNVYFDNTVVGKRKTIGNLNLRGGLDYSITDKHKAGLQLNTIFLQARPFSSNTNIISDESAVVSSLHTDKTSDYEFRNASPGLYYLFKDDSTGNTLRVSADYVQFSSENLADIDENITSGSANYNDKRSVGSSKISLLTLKADHDKQFGKSWKLSSGAKHYQTDNQSSTLFQESINSNWVSDSTLTNAYHFNEMVSALYMQLEFASDSSKFDLRLGLRSERTQNFGTSSITSKTVVDTSYYNIFPSFYAGYDLATDLNLALTYSTRFTRPQFHNLNPFVDYIDSVSAFIGNPFLLPQYAHNLQTTLTYKQYASVNISYTRTKQDVLTMVEKAPNTNAFYVQEQNINYSDIFNVELVLPYETKMWTTYNGFTYSYTRFNLNDNGTNRYLSMPSFYFYLYNELRLPKDFSLQGTFFYASKGLEGIFEYNALHTLQFTLTKKFFDKKLTVSLVANDILSSYRERGKTNLSGFEVRYNDRYDTHFYSLNLTYKFGSLKKADYGEKSGNKEEVDRINSK